MERLFTIWSYIRKYKYVAAALVFLLIIGVLDENCLWVRYGRRSEIANLRREIEKYQNQYDRETEQLEALQNDPHAVEKMAREVYLMKRPNEDIFVFKHVEPSQIQSLKHKKVAAPVEATEQQAEDSVAVEPPADTITAHAQ